MDAAAWILICLGLFGLMTACGLLALFACQRSSQISEEERDIGDRVEFWMGGRN